VCVSCVTVVPDSVGQAAGKVEAIGSALNAAHAAAAAPTTGIAAAGQDEVSAAIAELFSAEGQAYQALSAEASAFHEQFVQTLNAGAASYVGTEAANVLPLSEALLIAESLGPGVHQVGGTIFVIAGGELRRDTAILQQAVETDTVAVETATGLNTGAGAYSSTEAANAQPLPGGLTNTELAALKAEVTSSVGRAIGADPLVDQSLRIDEVLAQQWATEQVSQYQEIDQRIISTARNIEG